MNEELTHIIAIGEHRYAGMLSTEGNYVELARAVQVHSGVGQSPSGQPALITRFLPIDGCVGHVTLRNVKPDYIVEISDLEEDDKKIYAAAYKEFAELLVQVRAQRSNITIPNA